MLRTLFGKFSLPLVTSTLSCGCFSLKNIMLIVIGISAHPRTLRQVHEGRILGELCIASFLIRRESKTVTANQMRRGYITATSLDGSRVLE